MTRYKINIAPSFRGVDKGDGGIRRVVEAQRKYLPEFGFDCVDNVSEADIVAVHGGTWVDTNKPIVSHCHGLYWKEYEWNNWAHALNKEVIAALNKADATTAPSEWVARVMQRGMLLSPTVIYHGIDAAAWNATSNNGYVLWNKTRVDSVCDSSVVNHLAAAMPAVHFVTTFGDTAPNVRVTGRLPFVQAKPLITGADIYLCTTRETFGIGTLEAMACGVPVLGWAWGGQREIVQHKVTGYLATPGDYEDLIAGYNYCVLHRAAMSEAARKVVLDRFTWRSAIEQYAALYRGLCTLDG
jgi:hypothetical protein